MEREIILRGVRHHNLKNLSLNIPREKFIVVTGISGSGKSTLAFDVLYAEAHRRFIESLSGYARMFWVSCKNLMWTTSRAYHQPYQ